MLVLDASVVVCALAESGRRGASAREILFGPEEAHGPHLLDLEVASALRGLVRGGQLAAAEARSALADLPLLPLERHPHGWLLSRVWDLPDNATVYDAAYVALAEVLAVPLVTTDRRLVGVPGVRCEIRTLHD